MKFEKLFESKKYALILRHEKMDEYAVVYGLNENGAYWEHTVSYWNFGEFSSLTKVEALQKALDCFRRKTEESIECEFGSKKIANILINMSLDMDYADYSEFYQEGINNVSRELDALKFRCPELFAALEAIAIKNDNMEDWMIVGGF